VAHDAVRFNIAVCLARLGRPSEALLQYEAASRSQVLSAVERERARRAGAELRARVGTLAVVGETGTRVAVDGRSRCTAPCRVDLDPGSHDVVLGEGADARRSRVEIQRREEIALSAQAKAPLAEMAPPPATSSRPPPLVLVETSDRAPRGPGWLTWTGGAVAAIGVAGIVGFGLRAQSLHDDYLRAPTQDLLDRGVAARDLTNVAIAVAAVGGALIAIDLLFLAPRSSASGAVKASAR
jgi:hypothetical protein